ISTLIKEGYNQREIANEIGVHPSTICREFQRFKKTNKITYHPESLQIYDSIFKSNGSII
ncbi:MAG: helix-turn-helix domain-containing protein, partial [Epsilonproteobacteria bacterium]|nr:helix-turn-helix domain-containing protein [Campylobacterota bacterium]